LPCLDIPRGGRLGVAESKRCRAPILSISGARDLAAPKGQPANDRPGPTYHLRQ
jgi:hypothetical protein